MGMSANGSQPHVIGSSVDVTLPCPSFVNLSVPRLVEHAIQRREATLAANGALLAITTPRTGRSPKDKFTVRDAMTAETVAWGKQNAPYEPSNFAAMKAKVMKYLASRDNVYEFRGFAGHDERFRLPIRIVTEEAWHSLFVTQLFVRPTPAELSSHREQFTVLCTPNLKANPKTDATNTEGFILVNMSEKLILIGGTRYAGEMKKSIFTVMNYIMPQRDVFPMHCSANVGEMGDTAIFFGLSGTGKTTLSADPKRYLIGDDEHGWSDRGIFNFEGGCYAKTIKLKEESEPQIFRAIRFGSVVENVVVDSQSRQPDYDSADIAENGRCAYPLDFIPGAVSPAVGGHPKTVIFLTCDAFGVMPPISKLNTAQAMYHFLSGYTAKVAGTEAGVVGTSATFSTCFGEPFLPLHPEKYARLLGQRIDQHKPNVYLVNTGWVGVTAESGASRFPLKYTRALVNAAIDGTLDNVETEPDAVFGLGIPKAVPGVPTELLDPRRAAADKNEYDARAQKVAKLFTDNFTRFGKVSEDILAAGPRALTV